MDAFYDRLRLRAATIDELLSDDFAALPGATADADLTAPACRRVVPGKRRRRRGAVCPAISPRRLDRRPAAPALRCRPAQPCHSTCRRGSTTPLGSRLRCKTGQTKPTTQPRGEPVAFEELFLPLVAQAERGFGRGSTKPRPAI